MADRLRLPARRRRQRRLVRRAQARVRPTVADVPRPARHVRLRLGLPARRLHRPVGRQRVAVLRPAARRRQPARLRPVRRLAAAHDHPGEHDAVVTFHGAIAVSSVTRCRCRRWRCRRHRCPSGARQYR